VQTRSLVFAIVALSSFSAAAGYTHYYTWKQSPDDASIKACVADMNRLIEARKSILVSPGGRETTPGSLKLSATNVDFNGIGNNAHEPFVFPYAFSDHDSFNFCKTAWKPYDEVVTACLIVARDHFSPSVLEIDSDGSWSDWSRGAKLYASVFGRPARSPMTPNGLAADPAKSFWSNALISVVLFLAILLGFFIWQKRTNSHGEAWRRSFE
jgi:hypothetical protein